MRLFGLILLNMGIGELFVLMFPSRYSVGGAVCTIILGAIFLIVAEVRRDP